MTRDEIIRDLEERAYGAGAGQYMSLRCDVAREIVDLLKEQQPKAAGMTEAEKREKVIRGLKACNRQSYNGSDCQNCPYYEDEYEADMPYGMCNIQDMFDDALTLLKEQEPRVLLWEEVDKSGNLYVWTEIQSFYSGRGCLVYCTVVRSEFFEELFRLREDSGIDWTRTEEDYNRDNYQGSHNGWRCWSARPTEEQRKAVKWDD